MDIFRQCEYTRPTSHLLHMCMMSDDSFGSFVECGAFVFGVLTISEGDEEATLATVFVRGARRRCLGCVYSKTIDFTAEVERCASTHTLLIAQVGA